MLAANISAVSAAGVLGDTARTLPLVGKGLGIDQSTLHQMYSQIESGWRDMTSPFATGALDNMVKLASAEVTANPMELNPGNSYTAKDSSIVRS